MSSFPQSPVGAGGGPADAATWPADPAAWPAAAAAAALALANARYWATVAPLVRRELRRWRARALSIPTEPARRLALRKLRDERFNVEVAATLATIAPARLRARVVIAIVALQVSYDYLDALTEQPMPSRGRAALLDGLLAAVDAQATHGDERTRVADNADDATEHDGSPAREGWAELRLLDGGYLVALLATVASELSRLPAADAVRATLVRGARRCATAQALRHAAEQGDEDGAAAAALWTWAGQEAAATGLGPTELVAGASASVLCMHALLAAAAEPATTAQDAAQLDCAYLSIAALTLLDSLIDATQDATAGDALHLGAQATPQELSRQLVSLARHAAAQAGALPHAAHHRLTLIGVVAYYASADAAGAQPARAVVSSLRRELGAALVPALLTFRAWRIAKRRRLVSSRLADSPHRLGGSGVAGGGETRLGGVGLCTSAEKER